MTVTFTLYEDYMAALGWPEHHVILGEDWWGCLCGQTDHVDPPNNWWHRHVENAGRDHASMHDTVTVEVGWRWESVEDIGPTMADLHQWLWESEAF